MFLSACVSHVGQSEDYRKTDLRMFISRTANYSSARGIPVTEVEGKEAWL